MNEVKIEKGVPLPPKASGLRKGYSKHPFAGMEVGDSVFYAGKKPSHIGGLYQKVTQSKGFKFTQRQVEGGIRVWRVE